jgi:hypothetical protein
MGWVDDDNAAQTMVRDTPDDVFEEIAEVASDQELRRMVIHACDGRVGKKLLAADGLDSVRWLAAFVLWRSDEDHGPQDALRAVLGAMWDAVGSKDKNRRLNSLALVGSRIAAHVYNYGDCHDGAFYRGSSRYEPPELIRSNSEIVPWEAPKSGTRKSRRAPRSPT